MKSAAIRLAKDLRPVRRSAKILYAGAAFWLVSGVVHLAALGFSGWEWSGAISFRKPFVFSMSVGLLLGSVGWVLDRLRDRPRLATSLAWTFLVSSTVEVALIAVQAWRGRASHFNVMEEGDALIFALMGGMIGIMSLCLVTVLIWSMVERPDHPLIRLASVGGLVLVATGLGIGQWIVMLGTEFVEARSAVPETVEYGAAGVVKFPHAVALHGIQLFIVSAIFLARGSLGDRSRRTLMRMIVFGYSGVLLFVSAQTVAGRAPFEPSVWTFAAVVSLVVVATALIRAGHAFVRTPSDAMA